MASRVRAVVQDDHMNFHVAGFAVGGKKSSVTNLEKSKPRKPLQELGRNTSENISSISRDTLVSKAKLAAQKTKKVYRGLETNYKRSDRKPLGNLSNIGHDLTNSTKPRAKQAPFRSVTNKHVPASMKVSMSPDSATEERCLHDHEACIKAQERSMDFDYFLETVGLMKEFSTPVASTKLPSVSTALKLQTPMYYQELDDDFVMDEAGVGSPPHSPVPASPAWNSLCENSELSGFKMQETPVVHNLKESPCCL